MNISAEDFVKHMKEAVATAERIAKQRDEALARLAAVEAERDSLIDQIADAGKKVQALTAERDAARAEAARAVEALEKLLIGCNHLASALIHLLSDDFPEYETDFNQACEILNDPIKYDLWVCWAIMMRERDAMAFALRAGKGGE